MATDAMKVGGRVKFVGDPRWWTVRAGDERFTILTRQASFKPKGTVCYTIIDRDREVRGPCSLIGQGWDFQEDLEADAALLLASLRLHVAREAWADANRHTFTTDPETGWVTVHYPDYLDPDFMTGIVPTEVSYRNRVPIRVAAHVGARAQAIREGT